LAVAVAGILAIAGWLTNLVLGQYRSGSGDMALPDIILLGLGLPYLTLSAVSLIWLRGSPDIGLELTLFLFATVWATDIGAFFFGRICGGPRLAPEISPQKTWSGLMGGVLCAGLAGGLVALATHGNSPLVAICVGFIMAIVGQLGDLLESILKRRNKQKDSGALIPGHGGLLDRVDGLIASAPTLALFHATLGTQLAWW